MATDLVTASGVSRPVSKPDNLAIVEESARAELESLKKQQEAVERILQNVIAARSKLSGEQQLLPVRPDEYRGMRVANALESYLRARKGIKIPLTRVVADLLVGGVDPGQPRGRQSEPSALITHTLKITLPNKRELFRWEPEGLLRGIKDEQIVVWLSESADIPKRRKRKA